MKAAVTAALLASAMIFAQPAPAHAGFVDWVKSVVSWFKWTPPNPQPGQPLSSNHVDMLNNQELSHVRNSGHHSKKVRDAADAELRSRGVSVNTGYCDTDNC